MSAVFLPRRPGEHLSLDEVIVEPPDKETQNGLRALSPEEVRDVRAAVTERLGAYVQQHMTTDMLMQVQRTLVEFMQERDVVMSAVYEKPGQRLQVTLHNPMRVPPP
jgi:uncharacterized metal-binding protein YceD (DUF177 family)